LRVTRQREAISSCNTNSYMVCAYDAYSVGGGRWVVGGWGVEEELLACLAQID